MKKAPFKYHLEASTKAIHVVLDEDYTNGLLRRRAKDSLCGAQNLFPRPRATEPTCQACMKMLARYTAKKPPLPQEATPLKYHLSWASTWRNHLNGFDAQGALHVILDAPFSAGRLHRKSGDSLCGKKPWDWSPRDPRDPDRPTCKRCAELLAKYTTCQETHTEPDGTCPYMVENIYHCQPGEDWLGKLSGFANREETLRHLEKFRGKGLTLWQTNEGKSLDTLILEQLVSEGLLIARRPKVISPYLTTHYIVPAPAHAGDSVLYGGKVTGVHGLTDDGSVIITPTIVQPDGSPSYTAVSPEAVTPVPPHVIYTIGYEGRSPLWLLSVLAEMDALVLDIRFSPHSRNPQWNKTFLLDIMDSRYRHLGEWGNRNYKGGPIDIVDYEAGKRRLLAALQEKSTIFILCVCKDYNRCHRRTIAERLILDGFTVQEYTPPKKVNQPILF